MAVQRMAVAVAMHIGQAAALVAAPLAFPTPLVCRLRLL